MSVPRLCFTPREDQLAQQVPGSAQGQVPRVTPELALTPRGGAQFAGDVEALEESNLVRQISGMLRPDKLVAPTLTMPELPEGGRLDELLHRSGASLELCSQLLEVFREEPANDCGRIPAMVGMFHGFARAAYAETVFSPGAVVRCLRSALVLFGNLPNTICLSVPRGGRIIIVGDTHGQLEDVLWLFFKYGVPSATNQYLFDGDIVDRGGHALEILLLLLVFKRDAPEAVHVLRGNHEDCTTCSQYGFQNELESKFGIGDTLGVAGCIFGVCKDEVFPSLPLAAFIADPEMRRRSFVAHGGIPVDLRGRKGVVSSNAIMRCDRRRATVWYRENADEELIFNLLWADPQVTGQRLHTRANPFTEQDTESFCLAEGVDCVVRAHQPPPDLRGFAAAHGRRCVTVFSASNYQGNLGNQGGVLLADASYAERGLIGCEHWAPTWQQLADIVRSHVGGFLAPDEERRRSCAAFEERFGVAGAPEEISTARACTGLGFVQPPAHVVAAQLRQIENVAVDLICRHKGELFDAFRAEDGLGTGKIPVSSWTKVMAAQFSEMPPMWHLLAREWEFDDVVHYGLFLHRFQILPRTRPDEVPRWRVDALNVFRSLGAQVGDVAAETLRQGLDQDNDGQVNAEDFARFLAEWGLDVPRHQSEALFEVMSTVLSRAPTTDDVCLCISLASCQSSREAPTADGMFSPEHRARGDTDLARGVGRRIGGGDITLAQAFKEMDTDGDGFLSAQELQRGLGASPCASAELSRAKRGMALTAEQSQLLFGHLYASPARRRGKSHGQESVSLVEFLAGLGPRELGLDLEAALLAEVLRPVYVFRPMVNAFLSHLDPLQSGQVPVQAFRLALGEVCRQARALGLEELTGRQVEAACEIASDGRPQVHYREFLQSLRAVDTQRPERSHETPVGTPIPTYHSPLDGGVGETTFGLDASGGSSDKSISSAESPLSPQKRCGRNLPKAGSVLPSLVLTPRQLAPRLCLASGDQ